MIIFRMSLQLAVRLSGIPSKKDIHCIIQLMHYSKHQEVQSTTSKKTGKIHSAIEKAEAIQQRQQLRQMILGKFLKDFGTSKNSKTLIQDIVTEFFLKEKITEDSLKALKAHVRQAIANLKPQVDDKKSVKSGTTSQKPQPAPIAQSKQSEGNKIEDDRKSNKSSGSKKSDKKRKDDDGSSVASSSVGQKSVYYVQGDEQDEWATLVKFDTQLFKKQKQLQRIRQQEFKKKMKVELDRQLQEKEKRKLAERSEQTAYASLQQQQIQNYDQREKQKRQQQQRKIQLEKQMRDKQVKDQNKRRKQQNKKEQELDSLLVTKIKEELTAEERQLQQRREKQKQRLQQIMAENDINQAKLREDAEKERQEDVKLQNEYLRLQQELEEKRDAQKKQREEKIKKVMSSFADSVVKDQKDQLKAEDEKMLKHIQNQAKRDAEEDQRRKAKLEDQKKEMREYLAKQVQQKKDKADRQAEIDKMQATIWKQDLSNFKDHENKKAEYISDVNKKHQDILLAQMAQKEAKKNRKKMNTLELLYNKALMKEAAQNIQNVKKTNV